MSLSSERHDAFWPERLLPLASGAGLQPLFGDLHNHCALSCGHGSLERALEPARQQLDFVSITGHAAWPDMPLDDPSVAHIVAFHVAGFEKLARDGDEQPKLLARHDEPGQFVVFPGYEIHSATFGGLTIVHRSLDDTPLPVEHGPAALGAALRDRVEDGAIVFPRHIGYRHGARGIDWAHVDASLSPFVELHSMHGCAEQGDTDRPFLHSMGPLDGRSTVAAGLARGEVFGPIADTDHRSGYPVSHGHARTVAWAQGLDRQALWSALRARHVGRITGDRIHLFGLRDGAVPGDIVAPRRDPILRIEALAGRPIDTIDVIRNGQPVARVSPSPTPSPIIDETTTTPTLETLLTVEFGWGARGSSHRWQGSLRLEWGTPEAVEPRFRGNEVVSPLEGDDPRQEPLPVLERLEDGVAFDGVAFNLMASANPNNATPATQGFAPRCRLGPDATVHADFCGQRFVVPASRLFEGALAGNLGPIDPPARRLGRLPRLAEWQWHGEVPLEPLTHGDSLYLNLRQASGQMAWSSPFFCRR